ncbi:MAG: hypothetical protein IPM11_01215 [Micropruina sp.]|nr:hypothetical protein [Micropruina sp.]
MLSRTQVINNGLRLISANLIADPDEDTESARQAKSVYESVVRAELENHPWTFAKSQVSLPANADAPLFRFAYAYNLPADFIRLVELESRWVFSVIRDVDVDPVPPYELHGRAIFTDLGAPLSIAYIRDVSDDPTTWTALFGKVVSAALAVELAMPLTKSEGMVSLAEKLYEKELARARRSSAIQTPPKNIPDGSWITARLY